MKICIVFLICCIPLVFSDKSFTVDYKSNTFLKDGKPFRYVSGSIHYFRMPWQYWKDRLYKMKMAGLNVIQTYIEWSSHEPEPGKYTFKGDLDFEKFLQTAHDLDLLVILRPGPYIDAERDMGGLPYWLLRVDPNMKLRTYDKKYIKHVDKWYSVLLKRIEPFLYANGGPIIMIQVENEFGSTDSCDAHYKSHLRDLISDKLKNKVLLFTTDGGSDKLVMCGKADQVLSTIDFGDGTNVTKMYQMLRWHQASGPLVNSEYYSGWLDYWGQKHANKTPEAIVKTLTEMLQLNVSVNIYMFMGGTSFGFTAGSNGGGVFHSCPTSYDYDAPLNEAGDPTPKYLAMREAIGKFLPLPPGPVPKPLPKMATAPIPMAKVSSLWSYTRNLVHRTYVADYPKSFEDLHQAFGFVIYQTTVNFRTSDPSVLNVTLIRDRGYVYINKVLQGILSRQHNVNSVPIRVRKGEKITILVENQGRICSGPDINDRKGMFYNVTLGTKPLTNWTMVPVNLSYEAINTLNLYKSQHLDIYQSNKVPTIPSFYEGQFLLNDTEIYDSFLRVDGWHKGVAFLNGFNLGRYWPIMGPQMTLYAPGILFKPKPAVNYITLLELENAPCDNPSNCVVQFDNTPVINGTVPENMDEKKKT